MGIGIGPIQTQHGRLDVKAPERGVKPEERGGWVTFLACRVKASSSAGMHSSTVRSLQA
jgi:hypothetical protein